MSRVIDWLLRHPAIRNVVHRLAHAGLPNDQPCRFCVLVWQALEADPEFATRLSLGLADIAAGRVSPYRREDRERG